MGNGFISEGIEEINLTDMYVDVVYCLDLASYTKQTIDRFKATTQRLNKDIQDQLYFYELKQLRVKVIGFDNLYCNESKPFRVSDFFYIPNERSKFEDFVDSLEVGGNRTGTSNSLEALAMAIKSDWCTTLDDLSIKRHVIVLFTDASAHPLEKAADYTGTNYPANMPKSGSELVDWWWEQGSLANGTPVQMDQIAKRLLIVAPEGSGPWTCFGEVDFDWCTRYYIEPDKYDEAENDINNYFLKAW